MVEKEAFGRAGPVAVDPGEQEKGEDVEADNRHVVQCEHRKRRTSARVGVVGGLVHSSPSIPRRGVNGNIFQFSERNSSKLEPNPIYWELACVLKTSE